MVGDIGLRKGDIEIWEKLSLTSILMEESDAWRYVHLQFFVDTGQEVKKKSDKKKGQQNKGLK